MNGAGAVLEQEPLSVFQIIGRMLKDFGCSRPSGERSKTKSSKSYGIWAHQLSAKQYKLLMDRGWRRSGKYCYKPNMRDTCCPQYTIRLEAKQFKPSKSQRSIVNRFNTFVRDGGKEGQPGWGPALSPDLALPPAQDVKGKGKAKANPTFELHQALRASENQQNGRHAFSVELVPAKFTQERYQLYKKYQIQIHKDKESKLSEDGFKRFLCDSPLRLERSPIANQPYGSFHQLYRIDGKLVAIGVIDILPGAVSGVYFLYDPDYSALSLGKLSALRECSLASDLEQKGYEKMYYMMGYYIHSCQKMRYKAEYSPSFLLDPETYDYYPFEEICKPLLDSFEHASFSRGTSLRENIERTASGAFESASKPNSTDNARSTGSDQISDSESEEASDEEMPENIAPGFLDPNKISLDLLISIYGLEGGQVVPISASRAWRRDSKTQKKLREGISALGEAARDTCLCD